MLDFFQFQFCFASSLVYLSDMRHLIEIFCPLDHAYQFPVKYYLCQNIGQIPGLNKDYAFLKTILFSVGKSDDVNKAFYLSHLLVKITTYSDSFADVNIFLEHYDKIPQHSK